MAASYLIQDLKAIEIASKRKKTEGKEAQVKYKEVQEQLTPVVVAADELGCESTSVPSSSG